MIERFKSFARIIRDFNYKLKFSSVTIVPLGFLMLILWGTIMLCFPFSTVSGQKTTFLTALFTSTTSVCVTGGVVVPTFSHWSLFGKFIILLLIQLGGMGVIAVTSMFVYCAQKKFSVRNQVLIRDSFDLDTFSEVNSFLKNVFKGTFIVEMIGAVFYMIRFIPKYGILKGVWYSVFTAISAFCNAGIDILGPDSLISYNKDYLVMLTTIFFFVSGGLGYVVWFDIRDSLTTSLLKQRGFVKRIRRFNVHTRLVLILTFVFIIGGALCVFVMEYSNPRTIGNMDMGDKIMNSIFQSVTFRTAGFTTVSQSGLNESTTAVGDILMFIGGSPVGTAGGAKTITVFILLANFVSFIKNRNETVIFHKKVSTENLRKASAIFMLHLSLAIIISIIISHVEGINMVDSLYEVMSSISTVGLSRDVTGALSSIGQIIIIITMFLGRLGPISMALLFNTKEEKKNNISYGEGRFYIG